MPMTNMLFFLFLLILKNNMWQTTSLLSMTYRLLCEGFHCINILIPQLKLGLEWPPIAAFHPFLIYMSIYICCIGILHRKKQHHLWIYLFYLDQRRILVWLYMDPATGPATHNIFMMIFVVLVLLVAGEYTNLQLVFFCCVGHVVSILLNNLLSDWTGKWEPLYYLVHILICCITVLICRIMILICRRIMVLEPMIQQPVDAPSLVPSLVLTKELKEIKDPHDSKFYLRMCIGVIVASACVY